MATKKSAVDRVIAELYAEKRSIDATIARLEAAKQSADAKKKTRKPKAQPVAVAEGGR